MYKKNTLSDCMDGIAAIVYKPLGEKGEDSFAYDFRRNDVHAQAVFDGCGGAGAWKYSEYENATGAFIAAQSMADIFQRWIEGIDADAFSDTSWLAQSFHDVSCKRLTDLKDRCSPMELKGSMVKSFPCTAALALIRRGTGNTIELTALNTGDSRVYALTPEFGLIQITEDDSRGKPKPDPLDSIYDNPRLSMMLNADKPYTVNHWRIQLSLPCAVLCATDGVFSFLPSPMHFEYVLLKCLTRAQSLHDFEVRMGKAIVEVTHDDSTCIAAFYGWRSLVAMKNCLSARYVLLEDMIRNIDAQPSPEQKESRIRDIWQRYRQNSLYYEKWGQR